MHELRIAEDLSAIVLEVAHNENLTRVTRVNLIFGQLIQIVPDSFGSAFSAIVRSTIAEGSELDIEILPVKMKCLKCGNDFLVEDNRFSCSNCSSNDLIIIQGKELFVKSIEGE
jgi:hydrogenase nickel incorporation protein HypA/HybF